MEPVLRGRRCGGGSDNLLDSHQVAPSGFLKLKKRRFQRQPSISPRSSRVIPVSNALTFLSHPHSCKTFNFKTKCRVDFLVRVVLSVKKMSGTEEKSPKMDHIDETDEANEEAPCLPEKRSSVVSLNKNESTGTTLENEKVNENNTNNVIKASKKKRIRSVKFSPPPASKFEKWCSEKTGLSRLGLLVSGVLLILLFILFIVVVIMSCLWPSLPHSKMFPVCRMPLCLLASSEIISKMNETIDPCDDLRDYACGHWLNSAAIPKDESAWGMKQLMQQKHKESLRNLINTMPYPENIETLEWRVNTFYDSCMSLGSVETEQHRPLTKLINQLGGWNVQKTFVDFNWDLKKTLRTLHSKYNIQPFFRVDVVADPQNPIVQSIIQISPGKLGLPDRSYYDRHADDKIVVAYKSFLKDIAQSLGATSDAASFFSSNIFGFEKRLAERFPSRWPERSENYRPTIAKLESIAPSVPFFDILSSMFPDARLNKKTEVVVIAPDYLVNVSTIFSSTDRTLMNDFMMLKFAVGYLAYLSKPIRNIIKEFNEQLYGIKELKPRWEMCVETLQKFVGFGLEAMFESADPDIIRKETVVKDIFQQIRYTIKDSIEKSNNLPAHVQDHFLDKLNNIKIQVGLEPLMRHSSYYNVHYATFTSIKDEFFSNVIFGVSFLLDGQQKRLSFLKDEYKWMNIVSDGELRVTYVPEINQVVVPFALLSPPYFHPYYPLSVLYGGLGTEIGLAIISSITGRGLYHAGDGTVLPPEHPIHNRTHECFIHHPEATPHLEAIKFTYMALQNAMSKTSHIHQPGMENLEDSGIFFVSYAQSTCTMKTPERTDVDLTTSKHKLDDIHLLDMIPSKSKEYLKTFSCERELRKDSCHSLI